MSHFYELTLIDTSEDCDVKKVFLSKKRFEFLSKRVIQIFVGVKE
jgi:hypothetical protein